MLLVVPVRRLAAVVAQLPVDVGVVPQQLVHAAPEREDDEYVEEEELHDVVDHPAERDLERAEVVVDGEDVDES